MDIVKMKEVMWICQISLRPWSDFHSFNYHKLYLPFLRSGNVYCVGHASYHDQMIGAGD